MKYEINCPHCGTTTITNKRPKVKVDQEAVENNKQKKKEYKEEMNSFLKSREVAKAKLETFKEAKKEEYENYDDRNWFEKLIGISKYEWASLESYLSAEYPIKYAGLKIAALWSRGPLWYPVYEPTEYIKCPVCKEKIYKND